MLLPNRYNFASSFLICILFINLSCLILVAKASHTILKESKSCGHLCLISDLGNMVVFPVLGEYGYRFVLHASAVLDFFPSLSNVFRFN